MSDRRSPHLYALLGVSPQITAAELSKQYRKLSLQYHPDRWSASTTKDQEEAQKIFQDITSAYAVLSDPKQRASYDVKHAVNFSSRVSHLKDNIGRHNKETDYRTKQSTIFEGGKRERDGECESEESLKGKCEENQSNEDDDDDYFPESVASKKGPFNLETISAAFNLLPAPMELSNSSGLQQWKEVRLKRQASSVPVEKNDVSNASDGPSQYGLIVHPRDKTVVVGWFGHTKGDQVPVPSVIVKLGVRYVRRGDDMEKWFRFPSLCLQQEEAQPRRNSRLATYLEGGKPSELPFSEEPSGTTEGGYATTEKRSSEALATCEELTAVVTYCSMHFLLVGSMKDLADTPNISLKLVPDADKAELPSLLGKPTTILSVNRSHVESGVELRDALRKEAHRIVYGVSTSTKKEFNISDGNVDSTQSRGNPPNGILLEVCTIEGLPERALSHK